LVAIGVAASSKQDALTITAPAPEAPPPSSPVDRPRAADVSGPPADAGTAPTSYAVEPCDHGWACYRLTLHFHDHEEIGVPSLFPGMTTVPAGWKAHLVLEPSNAYADPTAVAVSVFVSSVPAHWRGSLPFDVTACGNTYSTNAFFQPPRDWHGDHDVVFVVRPQLEVAGCATAN
jgi:hypothetical protein